MRVEGRVVWTSGSWLSLDKDSIGERERERERERGRERDGGREGGNGGFEVSSDGYEWTM